MFVTAGLCIPNKAEATFSGFHYSTFTSGCWHHHHTRASTHQHTSTSSTAIQERKATAFAGGKIGGKSVTQPVTVLVVL